VAWHGGFKGTDDFLPHQDAWRYSGNLSMVCDVLVCEVYKAAGVFGNLTDTFQCTEFTNWCVVPPVIVSPGRSRVSHSTLFFSFAGMSTRSTSSTPHGCARRPARSPTPSCPTARYVREGKTEGVRERESHSCRPGLRELK
jgi:hypothetical protein